MIKTTTNNNGDLIVSPAVPVSNQIGTNQSFYELSPLFLSLAVSSSRNGKYNLNINDYKNHFYFEYKELGYAIKVPLTAIFNTNDKIKGILGVAFSTARNCPSRARGLCQLDNTNLCYAYVGECQGSKKSFNYLQGMGSYYNGLLSSYYFDLFYKSPEIRADFKRYCNYYNIDTLRFNLKGDFKNPKDIKCIEYMADMGLNLTGYTARDDLRPQLLDTLNKHDNIILNGSNIMYTNVFNAVDSIKELLTAPYQCLGGCYKNGCLNCYKKRGIIITVLLHGSQAGVDLNTPENRAFIIDCFKLINLPLTHEILTANKNLFNGLNNYLVKIGFFKTGAVPDIFLKVTKNGTIKFDGQNGIINYLRYILKTKGVDPATIGGC